MKRRWSTTLALFLGGGLFVAVAQAQPAGQAASTQTPEQNLRAYTELLRSDIRTQKVGLVTEVMRLTEAEDARFWPIYREYESELIKINDERLRLIKTYAEVYNKFTDEQADSLTTKALDLEARRTALKQKYYGNLKAKLSPRVAARAVQIEHQLDLLVDLEIASALPIPTPKK